MIVDYASLQTAVGNWLNRSGDSNFTARVPEFIQLAEAGFRRKLDDISEDASTTVVITSGVGTLPSDFAGLIDIADSEDCPILVTYDIVGNEIHTDPAITDTVSIVYRQTIPALSDTVTTNWLLTAAPDAYMYGSLIQAEFYGWNDERLPLIHAALDEAVAGLLLNNERRRWSRAPLSPQTQRT